ncbi:hypothetical protein H5410_059061 [Solanum commersonii]|uniref:Transmembrane protein n=1 Tax=Solanum commersonii TaxID=4109 RepID=A0A9J5W1P6_SOLCO|nr:hypothetical protein H5410_059061 [Solanum commersonii]
MNKVSSLSTFYFVLINFLIISWCLQSEARMFLDMENLSSIKFKGVIRGRRNRETPIIINPSPTANTRDHVDYTPPR